MANFVLEKTRELDRENYLLKEQLDHNKYIHTYAEVEEAYKVSDNDFPIGTIAFVEECLGIHENPIEIPKYLRTEEFLKREYNICDWTKIPRTGKYFLKDVSKLKAFSDIIDPSYRNVDDLFKLKKNEASALVLDKTHLYQVSSLINILSEYRVYIFGGEIEQISYYNGDCTVFPDINLIKRAVNLVNYHEKYLGSYTIDVAVTEKGTCLLEIHNFTSCGLYSTLWGDNLIYAYKDGIDYLRNDNHILEI